MTTPNDTKFILKRNKKTGNYTILKKGRQVTRVKLNINDVYLPFGREYYNDKLLLNGIINNNTNYNNNTIITLQRIIDTFVALKDTESGKFKYNISDKKFFSFLKEIKADNECNDSKEDTTIELKTYNLRGYIRYGTKVTHIKHVGELEYDQLKGKMCNLTVELGSLWVNNTTSQYGINIYVTHICVKN